MDEQVFRFDDSGLRNLLKSMESEHFVRIGVFGGDHKLAGEIKSKPSKKTGSRKTTKQSSGMTNAEVGFLLEYGSKLRNQPARSWLIAPITNNMEKIALKAKAFFEKSVTNGDEILFLTQLGIACEVQIEIAFDEAGPGWAPNALSTIARKNTTAEENSPGTDTGQLRRAVASMVI